MQSLRHRINPQTFVITLKQLAKHLKINPKRILNWEKWHNVLWVHIKGLGGYFISYRKLEQWIAACRTLIRFCRNLEALNALWSLILQEAQRSLRGVNQYCSGRRGLRCPRTGGKLALLFVLLGC
jgi:hypothetical protein